MRYPCLVGDTLFPLMQSALALASWEGHWYRLLVNSLLEPTPAAVTGTEFQPTFLLLRVQLIF